MQPIKEHQQFFSLVVLLTLDTMSRPSFSSIEHGKDFCLQSMCGFCWSLSERRVGAGVVGDRVVEGGVVGISRVAGEGSETGVVGRGERGGKMEEK